MSALIAGSLSQVSVGARVDSLQSFAPTGGTAPVTYQWYRSTTSLFVPGSGNIIAGATSTTLADSGLTPGTQYYYKQLQMDMSGTGSTVTTSQLAVLTTADSPSQDQFNIAPYLGMLDQNYNYDTMTAQFDPTGSGKLVAGAAVKFSTTKSRILQVVPCTAASDVAAGFVVYDIKSKVFLPGDRMEISLNGNVMQLLASLAINRGNQVTSLPSGVSGGCNGGVIPAVGGSLPLVGWALDTAAIGEYVRVFVTTPAYTLG